jgi:hypothetical protein
MGKSNAAARVFSSHAFASKSSSGNPGMGGTGDFPMAADGRQRLARKWIRHFGLEQPVVAPRRARNPAAGRAAVEGAEEAARAVGRGDHPKISVAPIRLRDALTAYSGLPADGGHFF